MKRNIDEISSGGVDITGSRRAVVIGSDILLLDHHKECVKNAWDETLKKEQADFDDNQKENIKKVRDFFNECKLCNKESISKKVDEFILSNEFLRSNEDSEKLNKDELKKVPENPKDLILRSIKIVTGKDCLDADSLYLNAYKDGVLKEASKPQSEHSELAQALVKSLANEHIFEVIRAVQKREQIIDKNGEVFELIKTESSIFLSGVKNVTQYGIIRDPDNEKNEIRRPGLDDNLKEKDKILLLVEQAEFEKIAQSQGEKDKDYYKSYAKALFDNKDKITILVLKDPERKLSPEVLKDAMEGFKVIKQVEYGEMVEYVKEFIKESKSPTAETTNRDPGGVPNPLKPENSQVPSKHH